MELIRTRRLAKEAANKKYDDLIKKSIVGEKRDKIISQDLLRAEMQMAYKQGEKTFQATLFLSSLSLSAITLPSLPCVFFVQWVCGGLP